MGTEGLNLDQKVVVKNIANWIVGFARIDGMGDISIPANGTVRLTRNEIISQVQNGNKLFTGTDGVGSHSTLYVMDEPTRKELEFDTEETTQNVYTDDKMKSLFDIRTLSKFKNEFKKEIVTRAEKCAAVNAIQTLKLNNYDKIQFVLDYTGYKL
ncbi:MAG: hypothetical protein KH231_06185 [Dialister sp.]|uniref:hypothetical protein n=1 Tax=Dialister sp. TaxID=1955814 RepID=UPI001D644942|nr:hypothetical protein [Dialister sp.]MBS6715045.1 hypothetical protein [Dialister sp.]